MSYAGLDVTLTPELDSIVNVCTAVIYIWSRNKTNLDLNLIVKILSGNYLLFRLPVYLYLRLTFHYAIAISNLANINIFK